MKILKVRAIIFFLMSLFVTLSLQAEEKAASYNFDLPGKSANVKLSDYKGKIVYLDFWASWCGPCKQSFPWMGSMQEKYRAQGLEIIAVNLDMNTDDAQKFLLNNPAKFTVAFDNKGQTPKTFGVKGMPTSYLLDREGRVIFQHMGFNESDKEPLEKKIIENLNTK